MKPEQFDDLLDSLAARLRLRAAAGALLVPMIVVLIADLVAVLIIKLLGFEGATVIPVALTGGVLVAGALGLALRYALRPISKLRAAAELDRLAGLKERAASLVAARSGSGSSRLGLALRDEARRALSGVDAEGVRARSVPLPGGSRWLGVLLAVVLASLLVPARRRGGVRALVDMLADGPGLVHSLESAAQGGAEDAPRVETARKVLRLVKAPPPSDPAKIEDRRTELEELARELRRQGAPEAAARLEAAFKLLAGDDGAASELAARRGADGAGQEDVHDRYPEKYRELLARYFSAGS